MATNNAVNLINSGIVRYDGAGTFTALANPLIVANGGTGDSSLTAYAVLCGGTTSTNPIQSIASVGTSGQVLLSNGAAALPTFQTVSTGAASTTFAINDRDGSSFTLADSTEYYAIMNFQGGWVTAAALITSPTTKLFAPKDLTITALSLFMTLSLNSSAGNASLYIRVNDTTDNLVTNALSFTSGVNFSTTSLNIAVSEGEYFQVKLVTPVWATNPQYNGTTITVIG